MTTRRIPTTVPASFCASTSIPCWRPIPIWPFPQSGSYTIGESADYPAFSINSDSYDTYLNRYDANGNVTETSFTAGTMEIAYEDGVYTIECKMTTESEEEYEFTYVGPIPFYNRAGEGEMSNLTDNVEISGLTQGMALYEPEAFTTTSDFTW